VTAWWGIWHIVAGMSLATFWRGRDPGPAPAVAQAAAGEAAP
jgi:bile acid:Na+ symporter, BASS family